MSTQPQSIADPEPEPTQTAESFTSHEAPRTFDPFNTRCCPELFEDKWQETTDGITGR
jgi:hypothetical protein